MLDREIPPPEVGELLSKNVKKAPSNLSKKIPAFAMSLFVAMSFLVITFAAFSMHPPQVSAYSPHDPITIGRLLDFTPANGVTAGNGTIDDPYIISGWEINSDNGVGIFVHDTSAYFVINDVFIHGTGLNYGIRLAYVTHGSIVNSTFTMNLAAIRLDDATYVSIMNNNLDDQFDSGIMMAYPRFVTIQNNTIDRNAYAIYAENTARDISIIGNSMDDSDYGSLAVIGQAQRLSVTGNTMRNSGWGDGIYIENTAMENYIADNNLSNNADSGISFAVDSYSNTIKNNSIFSSESGFGIQIALGDSNVIENNIIVGNVDDGVSIGQAVSTGQNIIANNTVQGNAWGISCLGGNAYQIINNTVRANIDGGISYSGPGSTISLNNITDNQFFGMLLGPSSPGNSITGNTFVHDGLYGQFLDCEGNTISGNTVNARPLVFLDKVTGFSVPLAGQVVAKDSSSISILSQNLSYASVGVELWNTVDSIVQGSVLNGNFYGVDMENGSKRNHVTQSNMSGCSIGVSFSSLSSQNLVDLSEMDFNTNAAVMMLAANDNSITGNTMIGNGGGAQISSCSGVVIQNNIIKDAGFGVMISSSTNVTLKQNDLRNSGIYGFYLFSSSLCSIVGNQVDAIGTGIYLYYSSNSNLIAGNNIYQNVEGIYISSTDGSSTCNWNNITGNNITGNTQHGIWLSYAQHNTLSGNNVTGNNYGILVNSSSTSRNWLFLNNFTANTINAYSDCAPGTNWWNSSTKIQYIYGGKAWNGYLGNRYGDYAGPDSNGDGIGETPYTLGKEQDLYPLMGMPEIVIPEFPGLILPVAALAALFAAIGAASGTYRKQ